MHASVRDLILLRYKDALIVLRGYSGPPVTDSEKIVKVTGPPYSNRERRNRGDPVSGVDPPVPSPPVASLAPDRVGDGVDRRPA